MSDLITFLSARLDEDERYAKAALSSPESANSGNGVRALDGKLAIRPSAMSDALALHFVRHDPARVLREVEAKRRILQEHEPTQQDATRCRVCTAIAGGHATRFRAPCWTLVLLAAVYSDHPDYMQEWKL